MHIVISFDPRRPFVLNLLRRDPNQTIKEIADALMVNVDSVARYMEGLEKQGYVNSKLVHNSKV